MGNHSLLSCFKSSICTHGDFQVDFLFPDCSRHFANMSAFDMGPAGKVSPLIKTARWGLLIAGIVYGYKRYNVLKAQEDEIAAYEAKMKPIWDAEKAAEKAKLNREQMLILAKDTGTPVPAGQIHIHTHAPPPPLTLPQLAIPPH